MKIKINHQNQNHQPNNFPHPSICLVHIHARDQKTLTVRQNQLSIIVAGVGPFPLGVKHGR